MPEKMKVTRGMPNNVEAEASVLGAALIDDKAADVVIPMLKADDFYLVNNREIFGIMKLLQESGKPIDTVSVADALEKKGKLNDIGVDYLSGLADAVPSAANCEHYAKILKRDSLIRRVIGAGNDIAKFGYECEEGVQALAEAERLVYKIAEDSSDKALLKADAALAEAMQGIENAQRGNMPKNILNTDFPTFDRKTKGLKPGEMVLLAARPSVGKTAFALNIAANACLNHAKTVAIFSLEMPAALLVKRMLAYVSKVSLEKMGVRGALSAVEEARIYKAYNALLGANLYIDDYSLNTPSDVLSKCRRLKREVGLDMVIIDYLQLMTGGAGGRGAESRQVEVSEMSRKMKIYAKELDVPMFILSQMSRDVEKSTRPDHRPQLSDLRESGSIEQDADIVMFLHNPSKFNPALPENQIILDIKKNRNGPIGEIKLDWDGDTTSFKECIDADNDGAVVPSASAAKSVIASAPVGNQELVPDKGVNPFESVNGALNKDGSDQIGGVDPKSAKTGFSSFGKSDLNDVLSSDLRETYDEAPDDGLVPPPEPPVNEAYAGLEYEEGGAMPFKDSDAGRFDNGKYESSDDEFEDDGDESSGTPDDDGTMPWD